jgi:hypothetical protein
MRPSVRGLERGWKPGLLLGGLLLMPLGLVAPLFGQDAPQAPEPEPPKPSPTLRVAEVAPTVNDGAGLSLELLYWLGDPKINLRTGQQNANADTGDLNYPGKQDRRRTGGAMVTIPAGKNAVVRGTYFTTKKTGGLISPTDADYFTNLVSTGDTLLTEVKLTNMKASYEYLTYFFNRGSSNFRVKTLWEVQYLNTSNTVSIFHPQDDGTYVTTSAFKDRTLILPTFGMGIENTVNRHVRWEAKASGFGLPGKASLIDGEASVGIRYGRVEFLAGGKYLRFNTSPKVDDSYSRGTMFGPYAGVRLYWKKK